MLPASIIVGIVLAIIVAASSLLAIEHLVAQRSGWYLLLLGVLVLPGLTAVGGLGYGYRESAQTEFCLDCHEMGVYGKSLFVDNTDSIPAVHYQKRLVGRDDACFTCHTNYALFGNAKAKLNGLLHVWVHYFGDVPAVGEFELYEPYPNSNCLHCHDDGRQYLESEGHDPDLLKDLAANEESCLSCHDVGHDLESVEAGKFWQASES